MNKLSALVVTRRERSPAREGIVMKARLTEPVLKFPLNVAQEVVGFLAGRADETAVAGVKDLQDLEPLFLLVERAQHGQARPALTKSTPDFPPSQFYLNCFIEEMVSLPVFRGVVRPAAPGW